MAVKSTIFKANVYFSDMDRHLYQHLKLTLARHPSETNERMMARLIAYLFHVDEHLSFTKGLSNDDEPDLWKKNLHNDIVLWIELGTPSFERLRKACHKAKHVIVYTYNESTNTWWNRHSKKLNTLKNLTLTSFPPTEH